MREYVNFDCTNKRDCPNEMILMEERLLHVYEILNRI